ncbi:hypothetical protein ACFQX8_28140 [Klenkia terrae]|uniref:hypothetical protein n=1 Tax=Klenkia terrae TaxID=1052259 RepID=UPI00360760D5
MTEHLALAQYAVNAVAARISLPAHVSREDLLSCAQVALVEVARRYDAAAGATFATYALPGSRARCSTSCAPVTGRAAP